MAVLDAAQRSLVDPSKRARGARRWLLFATVMAATLAGIGITLVVTQSWLRWVMVDAALIAFWRSSATATERGQQPADLRHPQR